MPFPHEDTRRVAFKINFQEYKIKSLDFRKRKVAWLLSVVCFDVSGVRRPLSICLTWKDTPNKTAVIRRHWETSYSL